MIAETWRSELLAARKRLGVSRVRLAEFARVSPAIVRAYEAGRREPTRDTLEAILDALRLDRREANVIRDSAGFAPVRAPIADLPAYFYTLDELECAVEAASWPQFVTDADFRLVAANSVTRRLWDFDLQREQQTREPLLMNILTVLSEPRISSRITNWSDILRLLVSQYKGWIGITADVTDPPPFFVSLIQRLTANNPDVLRIMLDAWPDADPIPPKVRWHYDVVWDGGAHGPMRFKSIVGTASERDGLDFNDWVPLDAATWDALQAMVR